MVLADGPWSTSGSPGMGTLSGAPSATGQLSGTVDVFWRGSSGTYLWRAGYRPAAGWSGPAGLGGDLYPVS